MSVSSSISPNIGVNTQSAQLRVELQNAFARLDGQISGYPVVFDGQNGPVGNTGSTETTLFSKTVETGTLNLNSSILDVTISGTTAANANNKRLKLYFGSSTVFDSGTTTLNNKSWVLRAQVIRNGGAAQIVFGQMTIDGSNPIVSVGTTTEDLTQNATLYVTGTGVSSADINAYSWKVIFYN